MAKKKAKKKGKRIQFELSLKGLFGLGIVLFCIFLWMFLLGIWAGQTVLLSESDKNNINCLAKASDVLKQSMQELEKKADQVRKTAIPEKSGNKSADNSIFSIQIASTDSKKKAGSIVLDWQARGYDAFSRSPENNYSYRVFVGRFKEFAQAKTLADTMERSENVRTYITLLSEERKS